MEARPVSKWMALPAVLAVAVLLSSCTVRESRGANGKEAKVDVQTPLGSIHVNANNVDPKATGIDVYPNSVVVQDQDKSANVNVDSSFFGVKVVVLKYHSSDPPDKVLSFYRDSLKRYGNVLECKGHHAGASKPGESHELTCDDDNRHHGLNINVDSNDTELKVGTTDKQHIVAVKPFGNGTEYSIVFVQTRGKGDSM